MSELQAELNRLAGTTGLDAQGAANVWAGTTGLDLVGALNVKAGNSQRRELLGVLNQMAGTVGLGVNGASSAVASYAQAVLADSPYAYWRLADTSGTTARDEMSNAHPGTYVNSPTLGVAGKIPNNGAITLTVASSQYVDTGDLSLFETGDCTYESWFKTTSPTCCFFSEGNTASTNGFSYLGLNSNVALFQLRNDAGTFFNAIGAVAINDGQWHHLVGFKSGTSCSVYVDGQLAGTPVTVSGVFTMNTSKIGCLGRSLNNTFTDGQIDEVAVYNTALSPTRILAHYNAGR